MKVSEFYHAESHWLRHPDLKGQARTVVIEQVTAAEFKDNESGQTKHQLVLTFQGVAKKLGLNKTNAGRIKNLYGDDTEGWIGRPITLYVEEDTGKGPGIRVLPVAPGGAAAGSAVIDNLVKRNRPPEPPPVESEDDYGAARDVPW
jgi:hypothetical protein